MKSEHCSGTNTTLVAYETAQCSRRESANPGPGTLQLKSTSKTGEAGEAGKNQEPSKHIPQYRSFSIGIEYRPTQTSDRARRTKAKKKGAIDMSPHSDEPNECSDKVRNRNHRDSEFRID